MLPRLLSVWLLLGATISIASAAPWLPGPAPQRRDEQESAKLNRACQGCHAAIAREWRASYHRLAYRDPAVTRALHVDRQPFCRACHAPEARPTAPATGWSADNGVACVTCHVPGRDGVVMTGVGQRQSRAPHPLRRSAAFAGVGACAGCHEFSFPDGNARTRPELMQLTLTEHAQSAFRGTGCVRCHMPRKGGHRSHLFLGGHDAASLKQALIVTAERPSPTLLRLSLVPQRIGHAFPTGDLFRRLELSVEVLGETLPTNRVSEYLMRHFGMEQQRPGHSVRVTRVDDRLYQPTQIDLNLPPAAAGRPLRWRVTYQRVLFPDRPHRGDQPATQQLDGEVLLAFGQVS